mmetsp:Transcript_3494/g.7341  ORF Transcript_3494/g.7341 Transcript_3494/m.7341 type:complete len:201 (-) Transcript_3494:203-805(-)
MCILSPVAAVAASQLPLRSASVSDPSTLPSSVASVSACTRRLLSTSSRLFISTRLASISAICSSTSSTVSSSSLASESGESSPSSTSLPNMLKLVSFRISDIRLTTNVYRFFIRRRSMKSGSISMLAELFRWLSTILLISASSTAIWVCPRVLDELTLTWASPRISAYALLSNLLCWQNFIEIRWPMKSQKMEEKKASIT